MYVINHWADTYEGFSAYFFLFSIRKSQIFEKFDTKDPPST